ncbi:MAG TPA: 30S ribosomal protein S6 [Gemmatimonadaceae bacterium]|jgi:small subunit ribosomal protein S6|nr:30S ribosomal protein S6 [Gemmatimonadaceae bacterium]
MSRNYEAVYIFDSTLEDAAINEKINRFNGLLGSSEQPEVSHWGRRQLAYSIGTKENGYYVVSRFSAEPSVLPEYERALKLDDGVIRYLITLYEHEVGAPAMSDEEIAIQAARRASDDDDEDED